MEKTKKLSETVPSIDKTHIKHIYGVGIWLLLKIHIEVMRKLSTKFASSTKMDGWVHLPSQNRQTNSKSKTKIHTKNVYRS